MAGLTISQVAKAANVNVETVKYYEKRELLSKPQRNQSGYRMFPEAAVHDVLLIKKAQSIGFTLKEIKTLLAIVRHEDYYPSEEMLAFAKAKVKEIEERMNQLESFKSLLEQVTLLPAHANPLTKQECPVINRLKEG